MSTEKNCLMCGVSLWNRVSTAFYCLKCGPKAATTGGAREAWAVVGREVAAGRMKPAKQCVCVDCGKPASIYDHRDYSKPLEVEPVCRSCNGYRGPAKPAPGVYRPERPRADKRLAAQGISVCITPPPRRSTGRRQKAAA